LAAWARPGPAPRQSLVRRLLHFVLPAALTLSLVGLGVYAASLVAVFESAMDASPGLTEAQAFQQALPIAQSALTTFTVLCGLLLIPFADPPIPSWGDGSTGAGDWRPSALALLLLAGYVLILAIAPLRGFFELAPLAAPNYALIASLAVAWALLLRSSWRARLLERFLSADLG
jgi:cation-transporting ATPase E